MGQSAPAYAWEIVAAFPGKAHIAGLYQDTGPVIFIAVEVQCFRMVHQHIEDGGEFFLPVDGLDTAGRSGFFFGVFVPFPDGNMLIGLLQNSASL